MPRPELSREPDVLNRSVQSFALPSLPRFDTRQIGSRLPPGPPTGRAFFGANVHRTFAIPSSPHGRRENAPAQSAAPRFPEHCTRPNPPCPAACAFEQLSARLATGKSPNADRGTLHRVAGSCILMCQNRISPPRRPPQQHRHANQRCHPRWPAQSCRQPPAPQPPAAIPQSASPSGWNRSHTSHRAAMDRAAARWIPTAAWAASISA